MTWKEDLYKEELGMIKTERVLNLAKYLINSIIPERAFFIKPSMTGKYHPECTTKKGGLIIHNKRFINIMNHLVTAYSKNVSGKNYQTVLTQEQKDLMVVAAIVHDMAKREKYSGSQSEDHPVEASEMLEQDWEKILTFINAEEFSFVISLVRRHMGCFGSKKDTEENRDLFYFSIPEIIFYFSDYLASRKDVKLSVDETELVYPSVIEYTERLGSE